MGDLPKQSTCALPQLQLDKRLNPKQRMFVEAFYGCPLEAARIAGYNGEDTYLRAQGNKLLSNPLIMQAIRDRSKYQNKMTNVIADKDHRQELWTSIMRNNDIHERENKDPNGITIPAANIPLAIRLKASELLGKSEGDFVERIDITGNVTITDVIKSSYEVEESVEALEAEYYRLNGEGNKQIESEGILPAPSEVELVPPNPALDDLV